MPDERAEPTETKPGDTKPTRQLERLDIIQAQLQQLLTSVQQHRTETTESFKEAGANVGLVVTEIGVIKDRIIVLESWKSDQDVRASRMSGRVKQASEDDLKQQAQLASVIVWRQGVDEKLAAVPTKEDLKSTTTAQTIALLAELKKDPAVQKAISALAGAVATAGALITAYLASKGH